VGAPVAAILVPTHDHLGTIELAVRSALEQTVPEIEVIVVGDGVGEEMRERVTGLARKDRRVRFLDLPKGPHHGEIHRGTAIESTEAEIVCYLCDDDLLFPDHVESMRELLADADLAHSQNGFFDADGEWHHFFADLASPVCRAWMLEPGNNVVSLTGTAHSVSAYRRLPHGWRTTPPGHWPDHYMWQQFLAEPWVRGSTATRVTALQFPTHQGRRQWTDAERRAELERWHAAIETPRGRERVRGQIESAVRRQSATEWIRLSQVERRFVELERQFADLEARSRESWKREQRIDAERVALVDRLAGIEATRTWRLRARLRRIAILRGLLSRRS
jgi:glycosyl transferase family 2